MTRTIQASDVAAFGPRPSTEHVKEVPAANNLGLEKEEPEFIHIPLSVSPDPKVYNFIFRDFLHILHCSSLITFDPPR